MGKDCQSTYLNTKKYVFYYPGYFGAVLLNSRPGGTCYNFLMISKVLQNKKYRKILKFIIMLTISWNEFGKFWEAAEIFEDL